MGGPTTSLSRNVVVYACCSGGSVLPRVRLTACVHRFERPVGCNSPLCFTWFRPHFSFSRLILFGHLFQNTLENELISTYDLRLRFRLDMPRARHQSGLSVVTKHAPNVVTEKGTSDEARPRERSDRGRFCLCKKSLFIPWCVQCAII